MSAGFAPGPGAVETVASTHPILSAEDSVSSHLTDWLRLTAGALLAAACSSEPAPDPPALVLAGVVTHDGAPLPQVTLLAAAYNSQGNLPLAQDTALSDANGAFQLHLEFDTLLAAGFYDLFVTPPFRSGLTTPVVSELLAFDAEGHADTTLAIEVPRAEPPVPDGPRERLDPARLLGHYDGRSVEPLGFGGGVELDLRIDSVVAGRPYGSYDTWFDATTGCLPGVPSLDGTLGPDSLYLRLRADADPVQDFVLTSFDVANDTLILDYTETGANQCGQARAAPPGAAVSVHQAHLRREGIVRA